jgi:hypothetical protein
MAQTRLEYSDPRSLLSELPELLELLEQTSAAANDQITSYYFRQIAAVVWEAEGAT